MGYMFGGNRGYVENLFLMSWIPIPDIFFTRIMPLFKLDFAFLAVVTTMDMAIDLDTTTTDQLGEQVVVGVVVEAEVALEEAQVHRQVQGQLLVLVEQDADKN